MWGSGGRGRRPHLLLLTVRVTLLSILVIRGAHFGCRDGGAAQSPPDFHHPIPSSLSPRSGALSSPHSSFSSSPGSGDFGHWAKGIVRIVLTLLSGWGVRSLAAG